LNILKGFDSRLAVATHADDVGCWVKRVSVSSSRRP
jgi:hypothetical protein